MRTSSQPNGAIPPGTNGIHATITRATVAKMTAFSRRRAKERGVHMGRPSKLTPHQRREALARRQAGEPLADIARSFAVSHSTISRL